MARLAVEVDRLSRIYRVRADSSNGWGRIRSLVWPTFDERAALKGISFGVRAGEIVGYIGANGAGKSTTFKIVAGILSPSSGHVRVDGLDPLRHRRTLAWRLGYLAGQKGHLWWDLPIRDTFELLRRVYRVPEPDFRRRLDELVDLLGLAGELGTPVRHLSLGTRTRAELAATFLHRPSLVLLDEPTIGLDVLARERVLGFLRAINRDAGVTILLASHDLNDVERICDRILLIDRGSLLFEGTVPQLLDRYGALRRLHLELTSPTAPVELPAEFEPVRAEGVIREYVFDPRVTDLGVALRIAASPQLVRDVSIEQVGLSHLVKRIYENLERPTA